MTKFTNCHKRAAPRRVALNRIIPTIVALAAVCCVQTANGESLKSEPTQSNEFATARTLKDLVKRIGREPDRSEQGGACGGILVHDWVSENIRAISLGGAVQTMSDLPDSARSELENSIQPLQTSKEK